jgi:hypothetical protein
VRPAIGVLKTNGIAAVEVNQIVDDERAWITPRDRDAAVARADAVTKMRLSSMMSCCRCYRPLNRLTAVPVIVVW